MFLHVVDTFAEGPSLGEEVKCLLAEDLSIVVVLLTRSSFFISAMSSSSISRSRIDGLRKSILVFFFLLCLLRLLRCEADSTFKYMVLLGSGSLAESGREE